MHQAKKMNCSSEKSFPPAQVGDSVRVAVSDVYRSRVDPRNVLFLVVSVRDGTFYTLDNKYRTLPQAYTRNQLTMCHWCHWMMHVSW